MICSTCCAVWFVASKFASFGSHTSAYDQYCTSSGKNDDFSCLNRTPDSTRKASDPIATFQRCSMANFATRA